MLILKKKKRKEKSCTLFHPLHINLLLCVGLSHYKMSIMCTEICAYNIERCKKVTKSSPGSLFLPTKNSVAENIVAREYKKCIITNFI